MKSKKNIILVIALLFIAFNVIAFATPSQLSLGFWFAYAFTVIAFAIELFMWLRFFNANKSLKSKFINLPILNICTYYAIVQFVLFLVFKFAYMLPPWTSIICNIVVLVVALICFISIDSSSDYIKTVGEKAHSKVAFIKTLQAEVEGIADSVEDNMIRERINDLVEALRFSDPMSDPFLEDTERIISDKVSELKTADERNMEPLIADIIKLINDRNRKCKMLK